MKSLFTGGKMKLSLPLRRSLSFDRSFLRELNFPPIYQLRYTYFDIFGQTTKISIATSISRKIFSLEQHLPRTFSSRSSIGEKKNPPTTLHFLFFPTTTHDSYRSRWHLHLVPLEERKERKNREGGGGREEPVLYSFNVHSTKRWNQRLLYYRGEGRCSSIPEREAVVKLPTRRNMIPRYR